MLKKKIPFEDFWKLYPRKDAKKISHGRWDNLTIEEQKLVMEDIPKRKLSEAWTKNGGLYIPFASTYLNQERWEDSIILPPKTIKYD